MERRVLDHSEVIELLKTLSPKGVAGHLHTNYRKIHNILHAYDIPHKHSIRHTMPTKSELEDLYTTQKLSITQIHQRTGIGMGQIHHLMTRYGIPSRSSGEGVQLFWNKKHADGFRGKKGGRTIDKATGYVRVMSKEHPRSDKNGYVLEHILVMEKKLGRPILRSEHIHHLNGMKGDNHPENLELLSPTNHSLRTFYCGKCELRKEIRLLRWQIKELTEALQCRLKEAENG